MAGFLVDDMKKGTSKRRFYSKALFVSMRISRNRIRNKITADQWDESPYGN